MTKLMKYEKHLLYSIVNLFKGLLPDEIIKEKQEAIESGEMPIGIAVNSDPVGVIHISSIGDEEYHFTLYFSRQTKAVIGDDFYNSGTHIIKLFRDLHRSKLGVIRW